MKQTLKKSDNIPFVQVANLVLNDSRLSLKAKGLFAYLYSKPQNWDFESNRIAEDSTDGRDAVRAGLMELEKFEYLVRSKLPNGRMEYEIKWHLNQEPMTENPSQPMTEKANDGKTHSGKTRPISNIELQSNTELQSNIDFVEFWKLYPKKVEKKKAEGRWNRLNKTAQEKALKDLPARIKTEQWQKNNGQFIPHPTTYLNGERWDDQLPDSPASIVEYQSQRDNERLQEKIKFDRIQEERAAENSTGKQKFNAMKEKMSLGKKI